MTVTEAKAWLLARAAERGVDLEVLGTSSRSLSIEAKGGKTTDLTHSAQGGVGLRVVLHGRVGYASTEELSHEALAWALDEAIENAGLQESGDAVLAEGQPMGRHDLLGEGLSAGLGAKAAAVADLEQRLSSDPRMQTVQFARYREQENAVEIGSSRGADGGYRNGYAALMSVLVMREGQSVKQGWEMEAQAEFHALEPGRTAQTALQRVGRQLGAKGLSTGRRRAVLEPEVVAELLELLLYALSGKTLAEGKSRLAGRLGLQVASKLVSIVDDATLPAGLASRPFDAEGTPSARLLLLEEGVLRSFLHNTDTARRTGQRSTGHASRGYATPLGVSASNIVLHPGAGIADGDGVLITDLMGVHAGANPITGDVSVQAMGMEMVGGEQHPVDDFAVSFNLFELLMQVEAVGDDARWVPGQAMIHTPSLAVADLSFAGS